MYQPQYAPYAALPEQSRGRLHQEAERTMRGPRSIFQRDRDRIIHSIAFRRSRAKTQVFIAPDGDHYRVRMTHSLEVAQIGRTIARALGLNEDLTEALCLAHDIGHPPFGHAGEYALQAAMAEKGGFDHNAHCLRVIALLESPYPRFDGLNPSWELMEGLAKHNGPIIAAADRPLNWALAEVDGLYRLELGSHASLEAQVAAIADDIAYDNHDIDDGLRADFLSFDELLSLPEIAERWQQICAQFNGVEAKKLRAELIRSQIGAMVNDVIATSKANIERLGVENIDDVRNSGEQIVRFSQQMSGFEWRLKRYMYQKLYHHPEQVKAADNAQRLIAELFAAYCEDIDKLPVSWREKLPSDEPQRSRHIADYIAGMTDGYALSQHQIIYRHAMDGLKNV